MTDKERIADRIHYHRISLAQSCRSLAVDMIRMADDLNSDKPHAHLHINELGEIQAKGTIIDAECGRLMGKIDVWCQMPSISAKDLAEQQEQIQQDLLCILDGLDDEILQNACQVIFDRMNILKEKL